MKRKAIKSFLSICMAVGLFVVTVASPASATIISPHAYAIQRTTAPYYGGYFYDPYGQANLVSRYNQNEFITNEMWNAFTSDASRWIEIGEVDGVLNGTYWAGHFTATQDSSGYREYAIGSNFPSSGHSFEIQKTGNNLWSVYVDYNKARDYSMPYSVVQFMDVGIETNTDTSTFTSGMYNSSIEYLNSSSSWVNLSSASNYDSNPFGWHSTFTSSNDRITYTR